MTRLHAELAHAEIDDIGALPGQRTFHKTGAALDQQPAVRGPVMDNVDQASPHR